jgi:hypothetical protein
VEFVTASANRLVKTEKFLLYPKKSKAVDALSMIVGSGVFEVIAANNEAAWDDNNELTEPLSNGQFEHFDAYCAEKGHKPIGRLICRGYVDPEGFQLGAGAATAPRVASRSLLGRSRGKKT